MNSKVSRRDFIKGTAVIGTFAAAGTLVACNGFGNNVSTPKDSSSSSPSPSTAAIGAKYAQGQTMEERSEPLVDSKAEWELVAHVEDTGIMEGMNWHDGTLWFIDVATSRIFKLNNGEVVTVYQDPSKKAMPNGAKFINDDTMLLCDRALGLCTYTVSTGEYKKSLTLLRAKSFWALMILC